MKAIFRSVTVLILLISPFSGSTQEYKASGLSPLTKIYIQAAEKTKDGIVPGYVYKIYNGDNYISALIKISPGFNEDELLKEGVLVGTHAGNILTAQIPVKNVVAVSKIPGIQYLQLDEPVHATLDSARHVTHVDSVQEGAGIHAPFFGKNVVVGIVDAGFDYGSPALWDTGGTYYRVKRIWAQKATGGTPPAGFIYGTEMHDSATMLSAGTDQSSMSHGAHVVGIAAGSGYGSGVNNNLRYRGMAPLSDIVLVGIMPAQQQWINSGGTDIIDGVNYVYQYAASVGKAAVVNLSWGASLGAHDGTSLFSQALDNLSGAGKIFVNSAGNSGGTKMHLQKIFTATDSLLNTFPTYNAGVKKTWVEMWSDSLKPFCVQVTLYNGGAAGASTGFICMDGLLHNFSLIGSNNDTCFLTLTGNPNDYNGKPHAFLSLYSKVADSICVTVKAKSGTVNMWNLYVEAPTGYEEPFTTGGKTWATAGDTLQTISDNASARNGIVVGAFSSKLSWRTVGGNTYSYTAATSLGGIAPFSSIGPTSDGRMKPDIAGPGFGVASTVNSYDAAFNPGGGSYASSVVYNYPFAVTGRTQRYAMLAGTSMSSPAAAGIIALLLEANKNLKPQEIKDILNQTAIHDTYTGAAMNNTWGGGKINAYQALKRAILSTGVARSNVNALACYIFPNPGNGIFNIGCLSDKAELLQIQVYDITGRCVLMDNWNITSGFNSRAITIKNPSPGTYIAKLSSVTGSHAILRTVIQ